MYIKRLKINNFRGIKELNWKLTNKFICLIGPGDSTKTTILDAIEWALYPYWNINVNDCDFYNCDVNNNIKIEITIGDFPDELIKEENYGLFLRKDIENEQENDEPTDEEVFLTIRLEINKYYEQEWTVVNNRTEGKKISVKDRMKLRVGRIGEYFYKDFNLGRNSVLKKYGDNLDDLDKIILNIYRKLKDGIDISEEEELKKIIENISDATKEYGIAPNNLFNAKIDIKNSELGYSNINIYDGQVPVVSKGTGTKRLMSSAMNISRLNKDACILIDEIEYGLEPYRLRRLIRNLYNSKEERQIIFTSHSPVSIVEINSSNIVICRSNNGKTECIDVPNQLQSTVRVIPEALLSRKVIVTEGKTELGLIRSLDRKWGQDDKFIEYYGVSIVDGNGGVQACKRAKELNELGYNVLILIDSDDSNALNDAKKIEKLGIKTISWDGNVSTEERIFLDIPKDKIQILIDEAVKFFTEETIKQWIKVEINKETIQYKDIESELGEQETRKLIGRLAKKKEWYKRIDKGEILGDIIKDCYDMFNKECDIIKKLEEVKDWSYEG